MFRHTILFILRSFNRYKGTFLINFIGLSSGLVCFLFIYLWVMDELHIDKFHEKDSQLFQVMKNAPSSNGISTTEQTPGRLAEALAREMPEIEYATSVTPPDWFSSKGIIAYNGKRIKASGQFIGTDYFNVFSYNFIQGSKEKALSDKYNIVLSEEAVVKLFKTTDNVIGKTLEWKHERFSGAFTISGVFKQLPLSSSLNADVLFNYDLFLENNPKSEDSRNNDPSTYVKLKKGIDLDQFNRKIAN